MFDVKHRYFIKLNMQNLIVLDSIMFDATLAEAPAERAMEYFGRLEDDEDVFCMVDTDWTHSYKRSH
jgi:hypothetical protein